MLQISQSRRMLTAATKSLPASQSRAEPRLEGTSDHHLVQHPGQRWVKHANSWATGLKFKQDTFLALEQAPDCVEARVTEEVDMELT